jgi:hypothetical protein
VAEFAPYPRRAVSDVRLSAGHWRLLGAVAFHQRLRTGVTEHLPRHIMAKDAKLCITTVSALAADLTQWSYLKMVRDPHDRRKRHFQIVYDEAELGSQSPTYSVDNLPDRSADRSTDRSATEHLNGLQPIEQTGENGPSILSNTRDTKKIEVKKLVRQVGSLKRAPSSEGTDPDYSDRQVRKQRWVQTVENEIRRKYNTETAANIIEGYARVYPMP